MYWLFISLESNISVNIHGQVTLVQVHSSSSDIMTVTFISLRYEEHIFF